jgi:predicted porin
MKKTILALAVPALLAASAAATAANVYKTDSQSMDVYGRVEADLTNAAQNKGSQEKSTDLNTSARLGIKGTTKLTDSLSAFARGEWQVNGENSDSDQFKSRHVYLGLDAGTAGNIKFGQTDTPLYTSLTHVIDIFDQWGMEAQQGLYGESRQQSQAIYSNTFGPVSVQLGYQFHTKDAKDTLGFSSTNEQNGAYSAAVVYNTGMGLNVHAAYARQNFTGVDKGNKDNYGFGLDYTNDNLYAGFVYLGAKSNPDGSNNDVTVNSYDLVGAYTLGQTRIYTGWGIQRQSGDGAASTFAAHDGTAINSYKLGVEYNFTSNFLSWVEYRHNNGSDAGDTANGFAANEVAVSAQYNF